MAGEPQGRLKAGSEPAMNCGFVMLCSGEAGLLEHSLPAAVSEDFDDGLVVDLPTAFYVTAVQVPNSKILGQFAAPPGGEHFGMVFQKSSPLVACVNQALAHLRSSGQLKKIQQKWLAKATGAPVLR